MQGDERTGMQRATLGKSGSEAASYLQGRIDRAFIFRQQFGEYHGDDGCYSLYFNLTAAQSLGSQDYYKKS